MKQTPEQRAAEFSEILNDTPVATAKRIQQLKETQDGLAIVILWQWAFIALLACTIIVMALTWPTGCAK